MLGRSLPIILLIIIASCNKSDSIKRGAIENKESVFQVFKEHRSNETGINFINVINESPNLNYFTFRHMYIGGGVVTADFNNDGLSDVYFTGNFSKNRLYLNEGNLKFKDITKTAKVDGNNGFYMGATTVDINNDGFLDIYVSKSGKYKDSRLKENLLFVNNGDLTFTERAVEYGINDANQSVQSVFFDYDKDGDLDMFLVNTPVDFTISQQAIVLDYIYSNPEFRKYGGNDKLYRNDGDKFTDVTEESGILPDLGFGLNVSISDYNTDGWPDIFVSNDFIAPDYLYINNGDGTFSERGKEYLRHTSFYSMGSDPSDINNDGLPDLVVLDMNPEDYYRSKTTMEMMDRDLFKRVSDAGYNNIYMHNMLHLNTGLGSFSEISQLSGISNTDWSWSSLMGDFDNDGFKDLHITNGIYRDVLDRDIRGEFDEYAGLKGKVTPEDVYNHLLSFPSHKIQNYAFKNTNGYRFQKVSDEWGMETSSFSNGSAMADFDNDGDLDLIVNNLMDTAFLYENKTDQLKRNFLKIKLKGDRFNKDGIGSKIYVETDLGTQFVELYSTKGYLSASEPIAHFGLNDIDEVSEVKVVWPDGKISKMKNVEVNQTLLLDYIDHLKQDDLLDGDKKVKPFREVNDLLTVPFKHEENSFDDYEVQTLIPYKYSQLGPILSVGDVNNDGLDDFFIGGAYGQAGTIYVQNKAGKFDPVLSSDLSNDKNYEDLGSEFIDFDLDGDLDLYVASGGYENFFNEKTLQDRLYENLGNSYFKRLDSFNLVNTSTAEVNIFDYDADGDPDIFVGGRIEPAKYPLTPQSYLLSNEGSGVFKDVTEEVSESLGRIGLVTSSEAIDINKDGKDDLILAGEWMEISVFLNSGTDLELQKNYFPESKGWWQHVSSNDFNKDGIPELFVGNFGLNVKYKPKEGKTFDIYASDFDKNSTVDPILVKYVGDRQVPLRGKECSTEQIPELKKKFETFKSFAEADVSEIIGPSFGESLHLSANTFETMLFALSGEKNDIIKLPTLTQVSPVMDVVYFDYNQDGLDDMIVAGNLFQMEVETTRLDASTGLVLKNKGGNTFEAISSNESGFYVPYDVKDIALIKNTVDGRPVILVASNNDFLRVFKSGNVKKPLTAMR
ncbi:MAG: FG-GAP-like repeat-containing protein [Bacteroidota bacterium]